MSSKAKYNKFAQYYDEVIGDRMPVAKFLHRLVRQYNPKAKQLLELGCGTGTMLSHLSGKYSCTGIDNSREMLKIAKRKAPCAEVLEGDITEFELDTTFDAVICPFDTINHLTTFRDWKRLFRRAHKHLNKDGIFIFDVNTEEKMESYRLDPVTAEVNDRCISLVEVSRQKRYHYTVHLTLLRRLRGDNFRRFQMSLPERIIPTEKIVETLADYFRRVILIDPDREAPSDETTELFLVCSEPR
jgi:SAM-dependent methyltransferase